MQPVCLLTRVWGLRQRSANGRMILDTSHTTQHKIVQNVNGHQLHYKAHIQIVVYSFCYCLAERREALSKTRILKEQHSIFDTLLLV